MSFKAILIDEFEKRVFEESYERIYRCFQLLNDHEIWKSPHPAIPSVGNIVLHLCGNARQWILSGIGEAVDNRNREQEFVPHHNIKKCDLVFLLENLRMNIRETLKNLPEERLTGNFSIQGFDVSGLSIIVHVLDHFAYHTGQITTLTKLLKNRETGYQAAFDLNRLNHLN